MRRPLLSLSRPSLCAIALICIVGIGRGVAAQDHRAELSPAAQTVAKRHFQIGHASFVAGRHREALKSFERANQLWPTPELHYNIGRCHEVLGHRLLAVESYRRYLTQVPAAADAEEVRTRIATLEHTAQSDVGRPGIDVYDGGRGGTAQERTGAVHRTTHEAGRANVDLSPSRVIAGRIPGRSQLTVEAQASRKLRMDLNDRSGSASSARPSAFVWAGVGVTGACLTAATTFLALTMNGGDSDAIDTESGRLISGAMLGTGALVAALSAIIYAAE